MLARWRPRTTRHTLLLTTVVAVVATTFCASASAADPVGKLTQFPLRQGCWDTTGNAPDRCSIQHGLVSPGAIAASLDGNFVYVGGVESLGIFSRGSYGYLTQTAGINGCFNASGTGCKQLRGVGGSAGGAALATYGDNVYYATGDGIAALTRSGGSLVQVSGQGGCVNQTGNDGSGPNTCIRGRGGANFVPEWLATSPDGAYLYAGSTSNGTVTGIFKREAGGGLSQASDSSGCLSSSGDDTETPTPGPCALGDNMTNTNGMAFTPDGKFAYVPSSASATVTAFSRDTTTGGLTEIGCAVDADSFSGTTCVSMGQTSSARSLQVPSGIVMSPTGSQLYIANNYSGVNGGVTTLTPTGTTGSGLSQDFHNPTKVCLTNSGTDGEATPGSCTTGRGLYGATQKVIPLAIPPDAANLYVTGPAESDIAVLTRDLSNGHLSQSTGPDGCVSYDGNPIGCAKARGIFGLDAVTTVGDVNVYGAVDGNGLVAFGRKPLHDTTPPNITITTPKDGAHYKQGQKVNAAYSCSDPEGPWTVALCAGPAQNGKPIDTSTVGAQSFTVQAADEAGNVATKTVHYTVDTTQSSPPAVHGLPQDQGCVSKGLKLHVSVHPTHLKRAVVFLDGKQIATSKKPNFTVKISKKRLGPGRHQVKILREYKSGTKRHSTFSFLGCRKGGKSPHIHTEGTPDRGTCTAKPFSIFVSITRADAKTILVKLDGKTFAKPNKAKFTLSIGVRKLKVGKHKLVISAADKFGNGSVSITDFVRCG